jgi:hypothetical protein
MRKQNFMKLFFISLTFTMLTLTVKAQPAANLVKITIGKLFAAIKACDGTLLKSIFADSAILQTISPNKEGAIKIKNETVEALATSISQLQKGDADERIKFDMIKIDGPLAIVWAPYTFYYKGVFSHCGVNSFQLVKLNGEWKIQYLIDTRRKKGCD